jgi:hypothetical protein
MSNYVTFKKSMTTSAWSQKIVDYLNIKDTQQRKIKGKSKENQRKIKGKSKENQRKIKGKSKEKSVSLSIRVLKLIFDSHVHT